MVSFDKELTAELRLIKGSLKFQKGLEILLLGQKKKEILIKIFIVLIEIQDILLEIMAENIPIDIYDAIHLLYKLKKKKKNQFVFYNF